MRVVSIIWKVVLVALPPRRFDFSRRRRAVAPLARDDAHCADAAKWCIARATAQQGANAYATDEASEATCWNAAICSAIMYYRRAGAHD